MKKLFTSLLFCLFLLGMPSVTFAEAYYKVPESVYLETMDYIEQSILINQQLQNKIIELKKQQQLLEEQIKTLEQQQTALKNSYENNDSYLMEQNKLLEEQSESMKKRLNKSKWTNNILLATLGVVLIKSL